MTPDARLAAADLTLDQFLGKVTDEGDALVPDGLVEAMRETNEWMTMQVHPLLEHRSGYTLRYNTSSKEHRVYLLHEDTMVGFFHETDSLIIHSEHQGKKLGPELILAAFAQKQWNSPTRKATAAGKKALISAHALAKRLASQAQKAAPADGARDARTPLAR